MPQVSVIVPNYNHASFLTQRLDSIFSQTFDDYEVILLDDCSTDNSREILEQYRNHPKVSEIIYNEINSGSSYKQWKLGIDNAIGEYIWIAESDDWCEPSFLHSLIYEISSSPKIVLGYVQSYFIEENTNIAYISSQKNLYRVIEGKEFIKGNLLYGNSVYNASMAIFKKSAYLNISHEYLNYKFCGDWIFWAEIADQGDVFVSGKILNYFRNNKGGISYNAFSKGLSYIEELQVLSKFIENNFITESEYKSALKRKLSNFILEKGKLSKQSISLIKAKFYDIFRSYNCRYSFSRTQFIMQIKIILNKILRYTMLWK